MSTRTINIETLRQYAAYLTSHQFSSFLPEIKDPEPRLPTVDRVVPQFKLERLNFELAAGDGYEVKDVFNNVVPSETIPYVCFKTKDSREFFARVYPKAAFPEDWFQDNGPPLSTTEEIYFRILTPRPKEHNFIRWTSDSKITFSLELAELTDLKNIGSIMERFKIRLADLVKNTKVAADLKGGAPAIVSLGGRFIMPDCTLDSAIFAAYVTNDPVAQKYLFFDEYQKKPAQQKKSVFFDILDTKGSLLSKENPSVARRFYTAADANPSTSVKLTLTGDDKNTSVRVSKVSSLANLATVLQYFAALVERFETQKASIIAQYEEVGLVLPVPMDRTEPSRDKSVSRLVQLQKFEPNLFGGNYARYCQNAKQPIGVGSLAEVDAYLAGHTVLPNKVDLKLNYSYGAATPAEVRGDKWYVCVPPPDPEASRIYPYLLEAHHTPKKTGLLDYAPDRPFVPCCAKEKAKLTNWLTGVKKNPSAVSSTMQPDKIVKEGARGFLPLALKEAWKAAGTYLRVGVKKSPASFIHCLGLAFDTPVPDVQQKFADGVKTFRTQETFGYTPAQLEKIIKTRYVNPYLFLGVAQNVLDVQIFLYAVTKKFPQGDVAHPRTAFAYLPPLKTFNQSVVIVVHEDANPPQCELIVKSALQKSTFQKVFFPDDPLVRICKTILMRSSQVFRVNPPPPSPRDVTPQGLDRSEDSGWGDDDESDKKSPTKFHPKISAASDISSSSFPMEVIQEDSLVNRDTINSVSQIYQQKIKKTGEIVVYKKFTSPNEVNNFVGIMEQYVQNYIKMGRYKSLAPPQCLVKDKTGKIIGYTMRVLSPEKYKTLDDLCQNNPPDAFQLAQIAQGIIQGMKDIKATGMTACPEHNKNIMVNIDDFKDVVLIDLDDIVKCNNMTEREIMEQLENIFISCKRLESIFNYPLEGLKLKLDIKKFDDLSKKILFPKKVSQLSARKFQPKISAELTPMIQDSQDLKKQDIQELELVAAKAARGREQKIHEQDDLSDWSDDDDDYSWMQSTEFTNEAI